MTKLIITLMLMLVVAFSGCIDTTPTIQIQPIQKIVIHAGERPVDVYGNATDEIYELMPEYVNGNNITSLDSWMNGCYYEYMINGEYYAFEHDKIHYVTHYRINNHSEPRFAVSDDGEHLHIFMDLETLRKYPIYYASCYPQHEVKM